MNNLLCIYYEISALKEVDLSAFIEERLDNILKEYESTLEDSVSNILESNLVSVVKELGRNERSK